MAILNKRSFTLIEALVAILIIAIILVVFLTSLIFSFNYLRRAMELRTATLVLQEQVSMVRELKFADIQTLGGTFSSAGMSSLKDPSGTIIKSSYEGRDKIIKITFRIIWTSFESRAMSKTLATLITDHGIDKK